MSVSYTRNTTSTKFQTPLTKSKNQSSNSQIIEFLFEKMRGNYQPNRANSTDATTSTHVDPKSALSIDLYRLTVLPADFFPSDMDIVVGTGRAARNHQGNVLFQKRLGLYIPGYSRAKSKLEKSLIISEIVDKVKQKSPTGTGFVKQAGGSWFVVDDLQSREKVSQGLRNILHYRYQSSAITKKQKRSQLCSDLQRDVEQMMQAKRGFLSNRMAKLSAELKKRGSNTTESEMEELFTKTNLAILEGLKEAEASKCCTPITSCYAM